MRLRDLQGLGPRSEEHLCSVGICTPDELRELGAVEAFIKMRNSGKVKPSVNFLYAMIGALEGRNWLDIAQNERASILMALEGFADLDKALVSDRIKI